MKLVFDDEALTDLEDIFDWIAFAGGALAGHFAAMRADNEAIPAARTYDDLRHDSEFIADSAGAIVAMVTPRAATAAAG